jgi:hypothetical protein
MIGRGQQVQARRVRGLRKQRIGVPAMKNDCARPIKITVPRAALVAVGGAAIAICAVALPSETVAAPKRHHEAVYYTITMTDAGRARRLKAKPQTDTGKGVVVPQGSVTFIDTTGVRGQNKAPMRRR